MIVFRLAKEKGSFSLEQMLTEVPPEDYTIESDRKKVAMRGRFGDRWRLEKPSRELLIVHDH